MLHRPSPSRPRDALLALLLLFPGAQLAAQATAPSEADPAGPRRPVIEYLNEIARVHLTRRAAEVAAISTREQAEARADRSRRTALELIGGLPAEAGQLDARVHGTVAGEGYRIEKLTYESLPGVLVSANLYLPAGPGPFPAILLTPGHSANGKVSQHSFAVNFARIGIASLAWDPISEGERLQYLDPASGTSRVGRVTGEHSFASVQSMLLGDHVSRYFVQDARRGIDYLQSRPEIDGARLGAFGCSGGGTVTSYLTALDPRIIASASACYITAFDDLLTGGDPQEAEQSIPGFIARGLDFGDWVLMAAPRPHAIVSTTEDMFPFEGARKSYEEAKRIYALYGAEDRLEWITGPGGHGALGPVSPRILAFFSRWLKNERGEPPFQAARAPGGDTLQVTPTGQLGSSIGSGTIASVTRSRVPALAAAPASAASEAERAQLRDRLIRDVREVAGITLDPGEGPLGVRILGTEERNGVRVGHLELTMEEGIVLPALLAVPAEAGRHPAILVMDGAPIDSLLTPGGGIEGIAREGTAVLLLQPRGTPGGTEEIKSPLLGTRYLLSLRAMLVGKTLLGMHAEDALRAAAWLRSRPEVDPGEIELYGVGPLGAAALHAALLDEQIAGATLERTLLSWRLAAEQEMHQDLAEVALPGVLRRYDLPDLMVAVAPRAVRLIDPVGPALEPATGERISEALRHTDVEVMRQAP